MCKQVFDMFGALGATTHYPTKLGRHGRFRSSVDLSYADYSGKDLTLSRLDQSKQHSESQEGQ